jgi:hypothetical protein
MGWVITRGKHSLASSFHPTHWIPSVVLSFVSSVVLTNALQAGAQVPQESIAPGFQWELQEYPSQEGLGRQMHHDSQKGWESRCDQDQQDTSTVNHSRPNCPVRTVGSRSSPHLSEKDSQNSKYFIKGILFLTYKNNLIRV